MMATERHERFTSMQPSESDYEWAAAVARSMCSDLPTNIESEDLEQTARLACIRCAANYDPSRGVYFRRYAHEYVTGAVLMELRRERKGDITRRHTEHTREADAQVEIPVDATQETDADRAMTEAALYRAVAGLPERERVVIAAGSLMDTPMKLVAERLGVSLSLAYVIRQRGQVMLRQMLADPRDTWAVNGLER